MFPAGSCQRLSSIIPPNDTSFLLKISAPPLLLLSGKRKKKKKENANLFPGLTRKTIRQAPAPTLPLYLLSLSFSPCVPNPLAVGVGQVGDQGLQRLNSESDNSTRRCSLSRHPPANSLPRDKSEKVKHLIHFASPIPTDAIYLKSYNLNQGLFWNIQSASLFFFSNILKRSA